MSSNRVLSNGADDSRIKEISIDQIWQLRDEYAKDAGDCKEIANMAQNSNNNPDDENLSKSEFRQRFYYDIVSDRYIDAFIMGYPHGTVIRQGARNFYFRGENKRHDKSYSNLSRVLNQIPTVKEQQLYRLVADMRIAEFDKLIHKFHRVNVWEKSGISVLSDALAQHYGLETDWLDLTDDFDTALFFATCKWDSDNRCWHPLTQSDTECDDERARYGVIFRAPYQAIELNNLFINAQSSNDGVVLPIGYQPFMRCHSQHGYSLHMITPIALQDNPCFERLYFHHDEKLSRDVFEMMDGGRKVYPQEGLNRMMKVIDRISSQETFSDSIFITALERENLTSQKNQLRNELSSFEVMINHEKRGPFIIGNGPDHYEENKDIIESINAEDAHFSIYRAYNIKPVTRKVLLGD